MRHAAFLLAAGTAAASLQPCDIYGSEGTPCVAALSTVRALFAGYRGPLYQVNRTTDGALLDVGLLAPGGFANAAAQDAFCAPAPGALPPLNTTVNLVPLAMPDYSFRHCDAQGFATPTDGSPDHEFVLIAGLDGSGVSFQSVNFPAWYIARVSTAEPGRLGVVQAPSPADASWTVTPAAGGVTLTLGSEGAMSLGSNLTGSCAGNYDPQSASVYLEAAGTTWLVTKASPGPPLPTCVISKLYDQTTMRNDLGIGPAGGNGAHDRPVGAARFPVNVSGHSVYAMYFEGGQGYRNDTTTGVATGNNPETIYMVTSGRHFNDGCCFDFGNAEVDNHDDGAGTMEAVYFGSWNAKDSGWCGGAGPTGPWVMADLEDGLWACGEPNAQNPNVTALTSEFVVGMVKGGSTGWGIKAGDAAVGPLATTYEGPRPPGYSPMKKQGALILGIGGDNSNSAIGTFFEGVVLSAVSTDAADDAVMANIVSVYGPALGPP
jgi:hypothetical protein